MSLRLRVCVCVRYPVRAWVQPVLAQRMSPIACSVICPGAVDSEMMPPFFKPFIPAFLSCR